MNRIRPSLLLSLFLSATFPVTAFARGGNAGGGGGGGAPHANSGGGYHGGSVQGGAVHSGGNVAAHPSFSQPNLGAHPNISNGTQSGINNGYRSGTVNQAGRTGDPTGGVHNNTATQGNHLNNTANVNQHTSLNQGGINSRPYAGNNITAGNRSYSFANGSYRPAYTNHAGFYHGYWNGNRFGGFGAGLGTGLGFGLGYGLASGGYGYGGYGFYRPFGWGLAGWGLGSLLYNSGYLGYYNPYYGGSYGGGGGFGYGNGYNYSQPIPVDYNSSTAMAPASSADGSADDILNSAVAAFKQNDYDTALSIVNRGVNQYPSDAVMHEFRALVLFAKGDFAQSAATIHSVLAVGPGWDWTTLSTLYPDVSVYTTQLRSLESAVKQRPDDGAARFLLAYHYMSDGYPDAAAKQLKEVTRIVPNDQTAADLLKMVSAPQNAQTTPATSSTSQPSAQPPADLPAPSDSSKNANGTPIDQAMVLGSWKASRDDGSTFDLTINKDNTFNWKYAGKNQNAQSFDGKYTIDGNVIALERSGGGLMPAAIVSKDGNHFNFKPVGAPASDPGLDFSK